MTIIMDLMFRTLDDLSWKCKNVGNFKQEVGVTLP
jgi:hypothetical protein